VVSGPQIRDTQKALGKLHGPGRGVVGHRDSGMPPVMGSKNCLVDELIVGHLECSQVLLAMGTLALTRRVTIATALFTGAGFAL
jgi:hypothetical protein